MPFGIARLEWIPRLGSLACGLGVLATVGELLVLLFSGLWVTHLAGMGFGFTLFVPPCRLAVASSCL